MNTIINLQNEITPSQFSKLSSPLKFLQELVAINSGTQNRLGVNRIQEMIKNELEILGFSTEYFVSSNPRHGNLLRGMLTADRQSIKTITLVVHADTVFEANEIFPITLNEDEGVLVGPGVIDDKGGVVVALKGLSDFLKLHKSHYNIQFLSSPNEELGSPGFTELLKAFGQVSSIVLGFEPAHDNGDIISSRAGNRWYKLDILGIEAHAGRSNGEEINAAHELVGKVSKLLQIKEKILGIKLNIGHFSGGKDKYNIVCGHASAKIDTRFSTSEQSQRLHEEIINIFETPEVISTEGLVAKTSYTVEDDCPPFEEYKNGEHLKEKYKKIIQEIEGNIVLDRCACGASDINYLAHEFNMAIDGLGPIGGNMHTVNEYLKIDSLITRAAALKEFLIYLNESQTSGGFYGSH